MLNISSKQVSKLINSLKAKGYIDVTMKYKENSKQIETRTIKPILEKFNTSSLKVLSPSSSYEGFDWNSLYANNQFTI